MHFVKVDDLYLNLAQVTHISFNETETGVPVAYVHFAFPALGRTASGAYEAPQEYLRLEADEASDLKNAMTVLVEE